MGITSFIVSQKPTICEVCGGAMKRAGSIKMKTGKLKNVYRCMKCNHRITSNK